MSLLFGVLVSMVLTLVVIPLGCVSARKSPKRVTGVTKEASPVAEMKDEARAA